MTLPHQPMIEAIHRTLDEAQAAVKNGALLSLEILGEQVAALCATLSAPPASAADYREPLEAIRTRLDALNADMQASQRALALSLATVATNRKAASAYRKQPTGDQ